MVNRKIWKLEEVTLIGMYLPTKQNCKLLAKNLCVSEQWVQHIWWALYNIDKVKRGKYPESMINLIKEARKKAGIINMEEGHFIWY